MRPRHKAAENTPRTCTPACTSTASMRPRHKAAENEGPKERGGGRGEGFNEAAA